MSAEPAPRPRSSRVRAFVLRVSPARIAVAMAVLVVAVYAVEIGARVVLDRRSVLGIVLALRHRGERAYPMLSAATLLERDASGHERSVIRLDDREVLPLGGISGVTVVAGDGAGVPARFTSDERGFSNPPGLWGKGPIDVLLLGDELTLGAGIAPEDNLAAPVRVLFPATLNLGAPGLGPLGELGVLREYGPFLRPRVTVIVFSERDDLRDLAREKGSLLARYLDGGFRQNLAGQRDALDRALAQYEDARLATVDSFEWKTRSVLELARLRALTGFDAMLRPEPPVRPDHAFYRQVLREAKRDVGDWGSQQLWLVYLPSAARFAHPEQVAALDRDRSAVISAARSEGLTIFDGVSVLPLAGDPRDCFSPRRGAPYNERGHRVVGEALRDRLVGAAQQTLDIGALPVVKKSR